MNKLNLVQGTAIINLPPRLAFLAEFERFVVWDSDNRDPKTGKQDKAPLRPLDGLPGSFRRARDWGTWADVQAAHAQNNALRAGYVFTEDDQTVWIDLDGCRDLDSGAIAPWAMKIVEDMHSYTEITPSGRGLRVVGFAGPNLMPLKVVLPGALLDARPDDIGTSPYKSTQAELFFNSPGYVTIGGWPYPGTEEWPLRVIGDQVQRLADIKAASKADAASNSNAILPDNDLIACADAIPNPVSAARDTWDDYASTGLAFWAASEGSEHGLACYLRWSQKHPKHTDEHTLARWEAFTNSPPDRKGGGSLIYLAQQEASKLGTQFVRPSMAAPPGGWAPIDTQQLEMFRSRNPQPSLLEYQDHVPRLVAPPASPFAAPFTPPVEGPQPFKLYSPRQLMAKYGKRPTFIMDDILTQGTVVTLSGLPGAAKSPIAQDLVVSIAMGLPWNGHAVAPDTPIFYFAAESARQTAINCAGLAAGRLEQVMGLKPGEVSMEDALDEIEDKILTADATFKLESDTDMVIATIAAPFAEGGIWHGRTQTMLVVFDTLRTISSGAITSDEDMGVVQICIERIRASYPDAVILILHHAAKQSPNLLSGSNRLDGMSETLMSTVMLPKGAGKESNEMMPRAEPWGPDADGWSYQGFKIVMGRNKTWQCIEPIYLLMAMRESEMRVSYDGGNAVLAEAAKAALGAAGGVFPDESRGRVGKKTTTVTAVGTPALVDRPTPQEGDDGAFAGSAVTVVIEAPLGAQNAGAAAVRFRLQSQPGAGQEWRTIEAMMMWLRQQGLTDPTERLAAGLEGGRGKANLSRRCHELQEKGLAEKRGERGKATEWRILPPG